MLISCFKLFEANVNADYCVSVIGLLLDYRFNVTQLLTTKRN